MIELAIFWVLSGILSFGMYLAHCQGEVPSLENYKSDRKAALWMAFGGLISFSICVIFCKWTTYGLMYRRPDERD